MHENVKFSLKNITGFFILSLFYILSIKTSTPLPNDQDGVNFLLGVLDFDIIFHQPHFPGYPVYIVLGKFINLIFNSPETSLVFLSVLSGTISLFIIFLMVKSKTNDQIALISLLFLAFHPVFFEFSKKIFTEMPSLMFLLLSVYILDRQRDDKKRWFLCGMFLGLLMGVRLSLWPFPVFYLIYAIKKRSGFKIFSGLILGSLLWFVPLVNIVGLTKYLDTGFFFTFGHFTKWGGTIGSDFTFNKKVLEIFLRLIELFGWYGNGINIMRIPWIVFSLFLLKNLFSNRFNIKKIYYHFTFATIAYLVWVILGQNTSKIRHFLPLLPVFILFVSVLAMRYKKQFLLVTFIFATTQILNLSVRESNLPPAFRFSKWVEINSTDGAVFYCGNSERFFDKYPFSGRIISVSNIEELDFIIGATWPKPKRIYICDDILGFKSDKKPFALFKARYGDPVDNDLGVYVR